MNEFEHKNCVIYTRVSSATQLSKGNWLQSQEALCRERAKNNNLNIITVFQDGWVSGKFSSRLWLDEMITFLKKENKAYTKIHYVLVDDIDRIIRDVSGRWEIKNKIEKLGWAQIRSLKQKIEDTPEGKLLQSMTMSVKQYERESNARRVSDRKRARLLDWYWVHPAPPWYIYSWSGGGKKLIHDEKAPLIALGLEKFSQWLFKNLVELGEYLVQVGVRKKFDKMYAIRLTERPRLLFYAGYIDFPLLWINMNQGKHEPIISLDLIDQIRAVKKKSSHSKRSAQNENFLRMPLRNTLYCEYCNKAMTWWPSYNKLGTQFYYYRCINKNCERKVSYNVDHVNDQFEQYLQSLIVSPAVMRCFKIGLIHAFENESVNTKTMAEERQTKVADLEKKIEKLYNLILSTESEEILVLHQQKLNSLIAEKKQLEIEIINPQTSEIDLDWLLNYTLPLLQNPYKLRVEGDITTKRLIPGVVLGWEIYYNKKTGITTPKIPEFYANISLFSNSNSHQLEITLFC